MRLPMTVNINAPTRTEYVTRTVHEHRAPTDESVRLLKEMEEAARQKVLSSIRLDRNEFKCVIQFMLDNMSMDRVAHVMLDLNGKKIDEVVKASVRQTGPDGAVEFANVIRDRVAARLAQEVLSVAFAHNMDDLIRVVGGNR